MERGAKAAGFFRGREGGRKGGGSLHTLRTANMYMVSRLSLSAMKLKVCAEPMSAEEDDILGRDTPASTDARRPLKLWWLLYIVCKRGHSSNSMKYTVHKSRCSCLLFRPEERGVEGGKEAMYSRGWPKSTAVGGKLNREGKDDDQKKSMLPPLPPGGGGGVGGGAVGTAGPSRLTGVNGGGEIRSPSHGGARARQAAQAQVAPQRLVPPIAVQGGGGGGGRIQDGSDTNGRGIWSGRTSQSPRRDSSTDWMVPPPSSGRHPSPGGSMASPSRGRPVSSTTKTKPV